MTMKNPSSPGRIIQGIIDSLGITITDASDALGVSRRALSSLIHEHSRLSPEMALRLEAVFGSTYATWINLQTQRDEYHKKELLKKIKVNKSYIGYNSDKHAA